MSLAVILSLGLAGGALVGCDDGSPVTDAGPRTDGGGGGTDGGGGGTDSGVPTGPAVGKGTDVMALNPATYACNGTEMAPTPGADISWNAVAADFATEGPVEGLDIQFYPDNAVAVDGTCGGTCQMVTSGAGGVAQVMSPTSGWYGYRIAGGSGMLNGIPTDFLTVMQFNEEAPDMAGGMRGLTAISATIRDSIVLLLGTSANPDRTTVVGTIEDCDGDPIANVDVRIFGSAGEVLTARSGADDREFYFNGGAGGSTVPAQNRRSTNIDGLYGLANLAVPGDNTYRVEAWGSLTENGPQELLGCESIQVAANSVTIINLGPVRSDGPTDCSN
ncbi:MAG: hypothetical protein AB7S26_24700 [Sandaracinaceae bacterium]